MSTYVNCLFVVVFFFVFFFFFFFVFCLFVFCFFYFVFVFFFYCAEVYRTSTLVVILCRLPEKGRKEIEEIVEEMKERDRGERETEMKANKQKK